MVLSSHVQEYATHSRDTSVLHTGATPLTRFTRFTRFTLLVTGTHGGHRHNAQKHNENNTNKRACLTQQHKQTRLLNTTTQTNKLAYSTQAPERARKSKREARGTGGTHYTPHTSSCAFFMAASAWICAYNCSLHVPLPPPHIHT